MTTAHSSTAPPPSRVQAHVAPEDPHRRGSGLSHRQHPRLPRNGATRPVPQALSRLLSPPRQRDWIRLLSHSLGPQEPTEMRSY